MNYLFANLPVAWLQLDPKDTEFLSQGVLDMVFATRRFIYSIMKDHRLLYIVPTLTKIWLGAGHRPSPDTGT